MRFLYEHEKELENSKYWRKNVVDYKLLMMYSQIVYFICEYMLTVANTY